MEFGEASMFPVSIGVKFYDWRLQTNTRQLAFRMWRRWRLGTLHTRYIPNNPPKMAPSRDRRSQLRGGGVPRAIFYA